MGSTVYHITTSHLALEPDPRRRVQATISYAAADRLGDVIDLDGLDLTHYRKAPIVLRGHDQKRPIARCRAIWREGRRLKAQIEFPKPGQSLIADRAWREVEAGLLPAASIGFRAFAAEPHRDGMRFTRTELLEISLVTLPSNPACTIERIGELKSRRSRYENQPRRVLAALKKMAPSASGAGKGN